MTQQDDKSACGYAYFMQPEPRENLGAVKLEQDDIFKRRVKVREAKIGMIRNASEANRKTVKVYLEPFPHVRIDKAKDLQGWYKAKNERKAVRPRPCYTEALLTEPYGGYCPTGCIHCYINSGMRGYRGTGLVTVCPTYAEQIAQQLSKLYRGSAGYLTSFHDPFNPLEAVYHNSQKTAQAFIDVGLPIFYLSRLVYPDWAVEQLTKNKHSYAQKSINTPVEHDWKLMSPGASSLAEHFKDIRKLSDNGIYVSIQVNPIIPGVTNNQQIVLLFNKLAEAGANHVIVKFVESAYSWAPAMVARVKHRFGERGNTFEALFTQNIGTEKTVDEDYRMRAHEMYTAAAGKLGLTYSVCYEYRYKRDKAGNIVDKTGISIGPEVTTSAQCHGQRVPMYMRDSLDKPFTPLKVCPPSGCLYCTDANHGEPKCKDEMFGQALALRLVDLKKPFGGTHAK